MENVLELIRNVNLVEIQMQIDARRKKLEERDQELYILRRILEAARAARCGIPSEDLRMGWQGWKIAPETQHSAKKTVNVQVSGMVAAATEAELNEKLDRFVAACKEMAPTTVHVEQEAEPQKTGRVTGDVNSDLYKTPSDTIVGSPVAAQERIHTIERAPSDTSEEDAAAEVEAVFAERASEEVKPVVEEVAVPPAEVVTPPTPTPEPPITKPRSLSPDARNQQLSICDRAKIYLEFAYNATAMAIGKGIDLPDPTCMIKHLQKDSRFVKDPRGFWKLAGT